jgi:hypothetical protein
VSLAWDDQAVQEMLDRVASMYGESLREAAARRVGGTFPVELRQVEDGVAVSAPPEGVEAEYGGAAWAVPALLDLMAGDGGGVGADG